VDLLAIAEKYDVKNLKSCCKKVILYNLNDSNALETFRLGHLHNVDEIKRATFNKIKKMFLEKKFSYELIKKSKELKKVIGIHCCRKQKIEEAVEEYRVKIQKFA
jgi:hypothetical protein